MECVQNPDLKDSRVDQIFKIKHSSIPQVPLSQHYAALKKKKRGFFGWFYFYFVTLETFMSHLNHTRSRCHYLDLHAKPCGSHGN